MFEAEEARARFLREARLQAQISHPNLVTVFDAGFAEGCAHIVMELVRGGSLRTLLNERGQLTIPEAVLVGRDIADGLQAAHGAGIVHRDLKPENVLLTEEPRAQVADFGLAKQTAGSDSIQTASGLILGTPGYVAPEVIKGESADPRADLYALGVILYESLTGGAPFRDLTHSALFHAQLSIAPPRARTLFNSSRLGTPSPGAAVRGPSQPNPSSTMNDTTIDDDFIGDLQGDQYPRPPPG
ncbi:MAG: serine/threonine protein kinase [Candidatus Riflebacteria bacterium]|nr:serine/threonine protein kinase [Candidatus Riflebacteria bacterium]